MSGSGSRLVIGTRGSELALWQARHVASRLEALGVVPELCVIQTSGDLDQRTAFGEMGGKGIFVKEIESALLEGGIDLAVHSLKDLPTELPDGLCLGATLEREPPFDALVSRGGVRLLELPIGATLASGSLRRTAQALALRPDLRVIPLRGNVPTRIRKIRAGEAEATMLAVAGLRRLGLDGEITETFSSERITPAMGQGAMAIECRTGELTDILRELTHGPTWVAVNAERAFLAAVGGGCKTPAGVLVEQEEAEAGWRITAMLASPDGASLVRQSVRGVAEDALNATAESLAEAMKSRADEKIRSALRK